VSFKSGLSKEYSMDYPIVVMFQRILILAKNDYITNNIQGAIHKWLRAQRIFKGLVRSDYEPKEYSSVLCSSSPPSWIWVIGQELNVVCHDRQTNINWCAYFSSFLSPLNYMLLLATLTHKWDLLWKYVLRT